MSSQTDTPKRPRGRPRRDPNEPPKPLTDAEREQRRAAIAARWGNRGESSTVRVDKDAAAALLAVPERDRRRIASDAIRSAVAEYART